MTMRDTMTTKAEILPLLFAALEDGSSAAQRIARIELTKMATQH